MRDFVDQVYVPDTLAIAGFYKDWFARGEGLGNFMTFGDFPADGHVKANSSLLIPGGVILNRDLSHIEPIDLNDPQQIQEFAAHSWYDYSAGKSAGLHPYDGETNLAYSGPKPPYDQLDVDKSYSWVKSPRWRGKAVEVGPLARVLMLYAKGHQQTRELAGYGAEKARPAAGGDVLDSRPHGGPHAGDKNHRRPDGRMARRAVRQYQGRRRRRPQQRALGPGDLAARSAGRRIHGSAARRPGALGRDQGRQDRQLSGGGANHLERWPARRDGPSRRL